MKELSVIIPVYNVASYLSACLDSLLKNNKISDDKVEVILVDDGSTDISGEICNKYAQKYPCIKVFHKKNGGLSSARNYGIERASGRYFAFIDSDDLVVFNYINTILFLIDNYKDDIVMYRYHPFEDNYNVTLYKDNFDKKAYRNISKKEAMNLLFDGIYTNYAWNKIYKATLFKDVRYPEGKNFEDVITTCKVLNLASNVAVYSHILYFYRQRLGSILHTKNTADELKKIYDSFTARKLQYEFFKKNGIDYLLEVAQHYLMLDAMDYVNITLKSNASKTKTYWKMIDFLQNYKVSKKFDGKKYAVKLYILRVSPEIFGMAIKFKRKLKGLISQNG